MKQSTKTILWMAGASYLSYNVGKLVGAGKTIVLAIVKEVKKKIEETTCDYFVGVTPNNEDPVKEETPNEQPNADADQQDVP